MGTLRRLVRGSVVVLVVLVAVVAAGALSGPGGIPWAVPVTVLPGAPPVPPPPPPPEKPRDRPTPEDDPRTTPIGVPLPPPPGGGTHAFTKLQDDGVTPVAYDPCKPVHYVLRPQGAPAGAEAIVHEAVARIAEVTGLRFVHDGYSDEPMAVDRPIFQPERYGDRWAPVLIGWHTEQEVPALAGDVVGQAGSAAVSLGSGPRVYVTGSVALDAPQLAPVLDRRDGRAVVAAIVLHELGHLVGLAHVEDAGQLMYPKVQEELTDLAAGDLAGLARLGAGPCVPQL
ncbi:matrixin family metalloprotease [Candidatus Blastococcus massiliensis]|uniref:matrixin family metalloprotease n=1 Tax=Candidatus Blastococcus massiliensis TaxID=1470358 RepID=UPI0004B19FD1|nr:matrixin family metalloprotease [Candidatus Blastococcus massiliensis]